MKIGFFMEKKQANASDVTARYNRDGNVPPHLKLTDALNEACFSQMTKTQQHYNVLLHAQAELKKERDMKKIHQECDMQSNDSEVDNLQNKRE